MEILEKSSKLFTFFSLIQTGFVKTVLPWLFIYLFLIPKVFGKQGFVLGSHVFVMEMPLL